MPPGLVPVGMRKFCYWVFHREQSRPRLRGSIVVTVWILSVLVSFGSAGGMADTVLVQEYRAPYPIGRAPRGDDVRAVAVDDAGREVGSLVAGAAES